MEFSTAKTSLAEMKLGADVNIQRLMLFDLSINGHHPVYIQHLIHWWGNLQLPFALDIVVSPKFAQYHADVIDLTTKYNHAPIQFVAISVQEESDFKPRNAGAMKRIQRSFQEWHLLCRYAAELKSDHCLILYFDPYQLSLIFAEKSPCPISGIYFRPTFHYQDFIQCRLTRRDRIQQVREKLLLRQVFRNPQLKNLFSLDLFAVKYLKKIQKQVQVFSLPDPIVETLVSSAQILKLREKLGVKEDRKIALLFGALTGRKGIYETLDSLLELPANLYPLLCLVLAGQANRQDQQRLTAKIAKIHSVCNVQIISQFEFVMEPEVPVYFQSADIVLAPYQHHVGMSGILLQAAAAGKPVLSSNFGLMGEIVKEYHLGLAIDSSKASEIAIGLSQLLVESNAQQFDIERMKIFAKENSAEKFASVIFNGILQQQASRYS
jgi:glycosyltransferase involved in cell wall biosynthesis